MPFKSPAHLRAARVRRLRFCHMSERNGNSLKERRRRNCLMQQRPGTGIGHLYEVGVRLWLIGN